MLILAGGCSSNFILLDIPVSDAEIGSLDSEMGLRSNSCFWLCSIVVSKWCEVSLYMLYFKLFHGFVVLFSGLSVVFDLGQVIPSFNYSGLKSIVL